jgi:hypothetical protein
VTDADNPPGQLLVMHQTALMVRHGTSVLLQCQDCHRFDDESQLRSAAISLQAESCKFSVPFWPIFYLQFDQHFSPGLHPAVASCEIMFREHFAHVAECVDIGAPCLDRGSVRQQRI